MTAITVARCDGRASTGARYPPFCADRGWIPLKTLSVQIWAFCAPTSRWETGLLVHSCRGHTKHGNTQELLVLAVLTTLGAVVEGTFELLPRSSEPVSMADEPLIADH